MIDVHAHGDPGKHLRPIQVGVTHLRGTAAVFLARASGAGGGRSFDQVELQHAEPDASHGATVGALVGVDARPSWPALSRTGDEDRAGGPPEAARCSP